MRKETRPLPTPAISGATFEVLTYNEDEQILRYTFPNGYRASVINHEYSYGWELAVLKQNGEDWRLCYDTPITDDVVGYIQSEEELKAILTDISKLGG